MAEFTVALAGIPIRIVCLFPETRAYFKDYLTDAEPSFSVEISAEAIEAERRYSDEKYALEPGKKPWSKRYLESLALLRQIADRMPEYGVILFHGSVIAVDGKAYLFTAPSGTGKTTHTRLWTETLPRAYILNGDKPFLKAEPDGRILASGAPWRGKEQYGRNEILPLEAICLLERDETNHIQAVSPKEALSTLLRQAYVPAGADRMIPAIGVLDRICRGVRLYRLGCNMDPEAAQVSIRAMIRSDTEDGRA